MQPSGLVSIRSSRVVAASRAVLACFLLLSTIVQEPHVGAEDRLRTALSGYLVYAVILLAIFHYRALALRIQNAPWVLPAIDLVCSTVLLYTTGGADSAFFSPLMFLIVAATTQFGSRGAWIMGTVVLLAFMPAGYIAYFGTPDAAEQLQFIVRSGYLLVLSLLLLALARHIEHMISELTRLSDPVFEEGNAREPPVRAALSHALRVFRATRGAFLWSDPDEPRARLISYERAAGFIEHPSAGPSPLSRLQAEAGAFWCDASGRTLVRTGAGLGAGPPLPAIAELRGQIAFDRALVIPAAAADFEGWILILDHDDSANEDLAMASMVSAQVSVMVDRYRGEEARRAIVAREERLRVARDLHDGVLQFLAGASLQLDAVSRDHDLSEPARERLDRLRKGLVQEQSELRGLISALGPYRGGEHRAAESLQKELATLCERLSWHWGIEVAARVSPASATVASGLSFDLSRLVREAVANAVRHGRASSVRIDVQVSADALALAVQDNGRGFPETGRWRDHELAAGGKGPISLRARANTLGGTLALASASSGARVDIILPLGGDR